MHQSLGLVRRVLTLQFLTLPISIAQAIVPCGILLSWSAQAQDEQSRVSLAGTSYLLEFPSVQEELKLEKGTIGEVKRIRAKKSTDVQATYAAARKAEKARRDFERQNGLIDPNQAEPSPEVVEKTPESAAAQARISELARESETLLAKQLTRPQRARLRQIALQLQGPLAVADPEIASRLNMSEEQRGLVTQFLREHRQRRASFKQLGYSEAIARIQSNRTQSAQASRPVETAQASDAERTRTLQAAMQKVNQQAGAIDRQAIVEVGKLLTRTQRDRFDAMLGEPFDVSAIQGPPPSLGGRIRPPSEKGNNENKAGDRPGPPLNRKAGPERSSVVFEPSI